MSIRVSSSLADGVVIMVTLLESALSLILEDRGSRDSRSSRGSSSMVVVEVVPVAEVDAMGAEEHSSSRAVVDSPFWQLYQGSTLKVLLRPQ